MSRGLERYTIAVWQDWDGWDEGDPTPAFDVALQCKACGDITVADWHATAHVEPSLVEIMREVDAHNAMHPETQR